MKNYCHLIVSAILISNNTLAIGLSAKALAKAGNKDKQVLAEKREREFSKNLRGNGLHFTPNKGQIADMNGKLCPDVLYKGDANDAHIYLRKTGISYVYSNIGEVIHEAEEKVEEKVKPGQFGQQEVWKLKDELLQKQSIKVHRVDMDFSNCNTHTTTTNEDEMDGYENYYYAHCEQGITNVHQYNEVTYRNIYNGIDVKYYGDKGYGIKYDLIVKPHADPNQIKLTWRGAESIRLSNDNSLVIKISLSEFTESIPRVYQNIDGKIIDVKAEYKLDMRCEMLDLPTGQAGLREKNDSENNSHISCLKSHVYEVIFKLSSYNTEFPLIIDPWATYYGGTAVDGSDAITTDVFKDVLCAGWTHSSNFPVSVGAFQIAYSGPSSPSVGDAFVVKLDANGARKWATYYGGTQEDLGQGISTDAFGNVMLAGTTGSADLPMGSSAGNTVHQIAFGGSGGPGSLSKFDAFLVKFDTFGVRLFSTFYGGTAYDYGRDVATDGVNIYLYGKTGSSNAISSGAGAFQTALTGFGNVFVAKFTASGARNWGTYVGGSGDDALAADITFDPITSAIYIVGSTSSSTFPVSALCHQSVKGAAMRNAFLFKFNLSGARLWASFYGGSGTSLGGFGDLGLEVAIDGLGNVILGGEATSSNAISTPGSYQPIHNAVGGGMDPYTYDVFIVKFNSAGVRQWGTYLGGTLWNYITGLVVDGNNNIYVYGEFEGSADVPISTCAYQSTFGGWEDVYIAKYDPGGMQTCITYYGGSGEDDFEDGYGSDDAFNGRAQKAMAIYGNSLYITGNSKTGNFPVTPGAFQTVFAGGGWSFGSEVFIAQLCINICESKVLGLNYVASATSVCANAPIIFTPSVNNSCDTVGYRFHWVFAGGNPASSDSVKPTVTFSGTGTHDVKLVVTTLCKKDSITKTNYITTTQCATCNLVGQFTKGTASCTGCGCKQWIMVTATGGTSPYSYSWPDGYVNRYKNKLCPGTYIVNIKDKNGCSINVNLSTP